LSIAAELARFRVALVSEFYGPREHGGVALILLLLHSRFPPEEVNLGAWRQEALVLLPLQCLSQQG
jgi:hypothetical protein